MVEAEATGCGEVEVAILGNEDPQASVVGEIVPGNDFYDYNAKYIDGSNTFEVKYEDLVLENTKMVEKIINFAGLEEYDELMKKYEPNTDA